MLLTFKKAFGFEQLPSDVMIWLVELGNARYAFNLGSTVVEVSAGYFGRTESESRQVERFLPVGRRPLEHPVPTVDIAFKIDSPAALSQKLTEGGADDIVAPFVSTAFRAMRSFLEAYRHCKYVRRQGTVRWTQRQTLLPQMTEQEFRTLLFYILRVPASESLIGSFSHGRLLVAEPNEDAFAAELQQVLATKLTAQQRFIEIAWERFFDEDYAGSVLYAAVCAETAMSRLLRKELTTREVGTASQIGRVVDDTSKRLLCTVVLGILGIGDASLRERLVDMFTVRNQIAHGQKSTVGRDAAERAIAAAEAFLSVSAEAVPANREESGTDQ